MKLRRFGLPVAIIESAVVGCDCLYLLLVVFVPLDFHLISEMFKFILCYVRLVALLNSFLWRSTILCWIISLACVIDVMIGFYLSPRWSLIPNHFWRTVSFYLLSIYFGRRWGRLIAYHWNDFMGSRCFAGFLDVYSLAVSFHSLIVLKVKFIACSCYWWTKTRIAQLIIRLICPTFIRYNIFNRRSNVSFLRLFSSIFLLSVAITIVITWPVGTWTKLWFISYVLDATRGNISIESIVCGDIWYGGLGSFYNWWSTVIDVVIIVGGINAVSDIVAFGWLRILKRRLLCLYTFALLQWFSLIVGRNESIVVGRANSMVRVLNRCARLFQSKALGRLIFHQFRRGHIVLCCIGNTNFWGIVLVDIYSFRWLGDNL
jgi:hypothetical protein